MMKAEHVSISNLGIEMDKVPFHFLKLVHHDNSQESRKIMLIGIKTDNIYKWDTSLKSMMAPTTTSLDQALLVIKKAIYEDKNIEYISD